MKVLLHLAFLSATLSPWVLQADPAAPDQGKAVKLELTADSTRDQVIAALKAKGVPLTDGHVDEIMAKLAAAKKGGTEPLSTLRSSPSPDPTEATASAGSVALRKFLRSEYAGMDLEFDPTANCYYADGKVNGLKARFLIDSGAAVSRLAEQSAGKLGFVLKDAGQGSGVGGARKSYTTEIKSLNIGPDIRLPASKLEALTLPGGGEQEDGLVGGDILGQSRSILDYRTHRLMYPRPGSKPDIAAKAVACGMQEIALIHAGNHRVLEAKVGDMLLHLAVDTGAQQTVLDTSVAKRLGIAATAINAVVEGVGANAVKLETGMLDGVIIDKVSLGRMPVLLMPTDDVRVANLGKMDGIVGADFLYASNAIFDVGAGKLYIEPGTVDVRNFTKTAAEMFASDAALKQAWNSAPRVIAGRVRHCSVLPGTKTDAVGHPYEVVEIVLEVTETLKGAPAADGTETIQVSVPPRENQASYVSGLLGRNPGKIIFVTAAAAGDVPPTLASTVWGDGNLPRAQLKRVR